MKKVLVLLALAVLAVAFVGTTACKKGSTEEPLPTATQFVLLDDFADGDNRTNSVDFGGYWYSFDDAAAQINPVASPDSNCGNSTIWPISDTIAQQTPGVTPTFVLSNYVTDSVTPPTGVTSGYYIRVTGNVNRNTATGYKYGFVGFGANLLDVGGDGVKNTVNAVAQGFTRLRFWYKNGSTIPAGTTVPWKIKLANSSPVGAGPCKIEDVDDVPVCAFTATDTWQHFDKSLTDDFANEGWPGSGTGASTACGADRTPFLTACAAAVGALSYYDTAAKYKNTPAEALPWLTAIQWQTNFGGVASTNAFDLEIAQVELVK